MASYSINVIDAGVGGPFSVTAFRNPTTAASGGTTLSLPWIENHNANLTSGVGDTQSTNQYTAVQAALRAILSDRSLNGD